MHGISINSINTPYFNLEKLYIALDKRLILRLKSLQIHKQAQNLQNSNSTDELIKFIENADILGAWFKEISLEKISFGDFNLALIFDGENFTLDTKYLALNAGFDGRRARVNFLEFKDLKANFSGDIEIDLKSGNIDANGSFSSFEINGDIVASIRKNELDLKLKNVNASSIKNFIDNLSKFVPIDDDIKLWSYEYVKAQNYHIQDFKAKIDLKSNEIKLLEGVGNASDIKVFFGQNFVDVKSTDLELKDDILSFKLNEPNYMGKDLNGSEVKINNIIGANSNVSVKLASNELSINDAHAVLSHFGVDLNAIKSQAKTKTKLDIIVGLNPLKIDVNGNFTIKDKNDISLAGSKFFTKNLELDLNGTKITFKNSNLASNFMDIDFSGKLDFKAGLGEFDSNIKKLDFNSILKVENLKSKISLDMNKNFEISVPELAFKGNFVSDQNGLKHIQIADLKALLPYSSFLSNDVNASSGKISAKTKDFENFEADIKANFNLGLKNHKQEPYNSDEFIFKGKTDHFKISSKSTHLSAQNSAQTGIEVTLNDLFIPLSSKDKDLNSDTKITFIGKNSGIHLLDFNRTFGFSNFKAVMSKNLDFNAHYGDSINITIHKSQNEVSVRAQNISERFINDILGLNAFSGGKFALKLDGKDFSSFSANVDANNTFLTQFKAQQNLINFFDSVPSLISFKVPDFSAKGFETKNARMKLSRQKQTLNIEGLWLNGPSADIFGQGNINLDDKNIDMKLQISTLKSASSLISKVPIVNQIVLGDDRKISTVVNISGTLNDPKYKTSVVTDILSTPFNLIKNTLTLPLNLFN